MRRTDLLKFEFNVEILPALLAIMAIVVLSILNFPPSISTLPVVSVIFPVSFAISFPYAVKILIQKRVVKLRKIFLLSLALSVGEILAFFIVSNLQILNLGGMTWIYQISLSILYILFEAGFTLFLIERITKNYDLLLGNSILVKSIILVFCIFVFVLPIQILLGYLGVPWYMSVSSMSFLVILTEYMIIKRWLNKYKISLESKFPVTLD